MPKRKKAKINLLVKTGFSDSTAGRVLAWILTSFRIIVIVTEILVMLAFLSRFWLDARNTDLDEEIKQKQAVLAANQPFEKKFKDTQARLEIFSNYAEKEGQSSQAFGAITSAIPPDTILESIRFSGESIDVKGVSPSERSVQQFLVNLATFDFFEDITLGEVTAGQNNLLIFNYKILIK